MSSPVVVVAAVIERDGKVLVCRRRANARHALKWEFPGGKVEEGEEPEKALARELDEELGITAVIGPQIDRFGYEYPGRPPIELIFFRVTEYAGEPTNREFEEIAWERKHKLPFYDFLEGDIDFVRKLAKEA